MWEYEKRLQYPIKITNPNPKLAKLIITQYGGGDGELGASLRYLSQRFSMPNAFAKGLLNDIGTEELAHLEIIGSICHQLLKCAETKELSEKYAEGFVEHGLGVYPQSAAGVPFTAAYIQSKGDPIVDLTENLAAEQKARKTYEYLISMCDDPDVIDPLRFLRQREIVHFQRFGEANHTNLRRFFPYEKTPQPIKLQCLFLFITVYHITNRKSIPFIYSTRFQRYHLRL